MQIYRLFPACGDSGFLSACKEQVCVFVATKTSRMPTAPGKLAFCARWLQKGQSAEKLSS
jgi:hypothetical protein